MYMHATLASLARALTAASQLRPHTARRHCTHVHSFYLFFFLFRLQSCDSSWAKLIIRSRFFPLRHTDRHFGNKRSLTHAPKHTRRHRLRRIRTPQPHAIKHPPMNPNHCIGSCFGPSWMWHGQPVEIRNRWIKAVLASLSSPSSVFLSLTSLFNSQNKPPILLLLHCLCSTCLVYQF